MRAHDSVILFSTFRPSSRQAGTTMPSADFCVLTPHVAMQGATELLMSCCLFCVSLFRDSYPSTATEYAGSLVNRVDLFRISLMNLLSRDSQISPDKDVNFPCTNAAFTLPHEPAGFVVIGQLAQGLSLLCGFCSSSRMFALRLPFRPSGSAEADRPLLAETCLPAGRRPCLRLVLLVVFIYYENLRVLVQGTFTP